MEATFQLHKQVAVELWECSHEVGDLSLGTAGRKNFEVRICTPLPGARTSPEAYIYMHICIYI